MAVVYYIIVGLCLLILCLIALAYVLWQKSQILSQLSFSHSKILVIGSNPSIQNKLLFELCLNISQCKLDHIKVRLLEHNEEERYKKQRLKKSFQLTANSPNSDQKLPKKGSAQIGANELSTKDKLSLHLQSPEQLVCDHEDSNLIEIQLMSKEAPDTPTIIELMQTLPALNQPQFNQNLHSNVELSAFMSLVIILDAEDLSDETLTSTVEFPKKKKAHSVEKLTVHKYSKQNIISNANKIMQSWLAEKNGSLANLPPMTGYRSKVPKDRISSGCPPYFINLLHNAKPNQTQTCIVSQFPEITEHIHYEFTNLTQSKQSFINEADHISQSALTVKATDKQEKLIVSDDLENKARGGDDQLVHQGSFAHNFLEEFLSDIGSKITTIHQQRLRSLQLRKVVKKLIWLTLFIVISSLYLLSTHMLVSQLPHLQAVDQWSVESLIHVEQTLLEKQQESRSVSPMWFAESFITEELSHLDQVLNQFVDSQIQEQLIVIETFIEDSQIKHSNRLDNGSANRSQTYNQNGILKSLVWGMKSNQDITQNHLIEQQALLFNLIKRSQARQKNYASHNLINGQQKTEVGLHERSQYLAKLYLQQNFIAQMKYNKNTLSLLKAINSFESNSNKYFKLTEKQNCTNNPEIFCRIRLSQTQLTVLAYQQALSLIDPPMFPKLMNWKKALCHSRVNALFKKYSHHLDSEYDSMLRKTWNKIFPNPDPYQALSHKLIKSLKTKKKPASQQLTLVFKRHISALKNLKSIQKAQKALISTTSLTQCQKEIWPDHWHQNWLKEVLHHARKLKSPLSYFDDNKYIEKDMGEEFFKWALAQLNPAQRNPLQLELYHERWNRRLKNSLQASSPQSLKRTINDISIHVESLISKQTQTLNLHTKKALIKKPLKDLYRAQQLYLQAWQKHLNNLSEWLAPRTIWIRYDTIKCQDNALKAHGESRWSFFLGDQLHYYFTVEVNDKVFLSTRSEQNRFIIKWNPWSKVSIRIYEQDGEIDLLSTENNDHQIGLTRAKTWLYLPGETEHKITISKQEHLDLSSVHVRKAKLSTEAQKLFLNENQTCWTKATFTQQN